MFAQASPGFRQVREGARQEIQLLMAFAIREFQGLGWPWALTIMPLGGKTILGGKL
jgi:hypothetical protein